MPEILKEIPFTPLNKSLPLLEKTVSKECGIVTEVHELIPTIDDARSFYISADLTDVRPMIGQSVDITCGGGAYTKDKAKAAAIGEALERYSALFLPVDELITDHANGLGQVALSPAELKLFHEEQFKDPNFKYSPFEKDTLLSWVKGYSLTKNEETLLPAQLVYLSSLEGSKDVPIGYSTSNGLACGPSFEEATLSALLEVVERDAIMITWYNQLSHPLFDLESDLLLQKEINRHLRPTGLEHSVVDLSIITGIPTALATVRNRKSNSAVYALGGGAEVTERSAVSEALLEAYQTRSWARLLQMDWNGVEIKKKDIKDFDDHILYYLNEKNLKHAEFLSSSTLKAPIETTSKFIADTPKEQIDLIVTHLKAQGINV